ncbi:MAG: hypothetical protein ACPL1A_02975 [Candidatus Kapaibacteriota bacterium]
MKKILYSILSLLIIAFTSLSILAQDEDKFNPFKQDEKMKYYNKDGYEEDLPFAFEKVYKATQQAIEELSCQVMTKSYTQTDEGLYKGKVFSDYCVFIGKTDTTLDNLERYSVKVPIIRGGVWINGRMQYKFLLTELPNGSTHLKLKGEISGREDYVTAKVHFWESCGIFEKRILDRIKEILTTNSLKE